MKIIYWYSIETGYTVTTGTPMPDDMADRFCEKQLFPTLFHWTVRYFPAV